MCFSCPSDAASGLSDGNDGTTSGGRHEGRSLKRQQRRSVRSRSRHEKTAKAKLNVLSVRIFTNENVYILFFKLFVTEQF